VLRRKEKPVRTGCLTEKSGEKRNRERQPRNVDATTNHPISLVREPQESVRKRRPNPSVAEINSPNPFSKNATLKGDEYEEKKQQKKPSRNNRKESRKKKSGLTDFQNRRKAAKNSQNPHEQRGPSPKAHRQKKYPENQTIEPVRGKNHRGKQTTK